jgi:hypothetical protein
MAVARHPEFTPGGVVADARARITDLVDTLWVGRTDGELSGVVEEIQALRSALAAVEAGAVAEATHVVWRRACCTTGARLTGSPTSVGSAVVKDASWSPGPKP